MKKPLKKKQIKEQKTKEQKKVDEAVFSEHTPKINLEYLTRLVDKVKEKGAKMLRCIEITPGKDDVVMKLLNIISVECSESLGHPEVPQGAVTRIAINVSDEPRFKCQTIEHFSKIMDILKKKVKEQNRKNVVVTINFKSTLDPKKPHEKIYKNTRYFYDDELDVFYFAVGYPTSAYIQNFVANNPDIAKTDKLIEYVITKNSAEKDSFGTL